MKLTRLWITIVLIAGWALPSSAGRTLQSYIREDGFIWKDPGYTWKDCRPGDPNSKYTPDTIDESFYKDRYSKGGEEACKNRLVHLNALDPIDIVIGDDGRPVFKTGEYLIDGNVVTKKFYKVQANGQEGFISEMQLPAISDRPLPQTESPPPKESVVAETAPCPPTKAKTGDGAKSAKPLAKTGLDIISHLDLGPWKSKTEIDRFACLHHGHRDGRAFENVLKKFQVAAQSAEKNFKVPYALTMCMMMDESALRFNPKETKEYRGYGQFGSAIVSDLQDKVAQKPYSEMWKAYKAENPSAEFTDQSIRNSDNPASSAAAVAMALRWIYGERFEAVKCTDCTGPRGISRREAPLTDLNRKDLYLLISGYDYSPYSLEKLKKLSPTQMQYGFPPPKETRHYFRQIERCLSKGQEQAFRVEGKSTVEKKRMRECDSTHPVQ